MIFVRGVRKQRVVYRNAMNWRPRHDQRVAKLEDLTLEGRVLGRTPHGTYRVRWDNGIHECLAAQRLKPLEE